MDLGRTAGATYDSRSRIQLGGQLSEVHLQIPHSTHSSSSAWPACFAMPLTQACDV
jgi:hypothetical protein